MIFLSKLWLFITSKAGMILGAVALAGIVALKLINRGYNNRVQEERKEDAEARDRIDSVVPPSSGDTADRLSDGTF